ncbi:hypothetical protein CsSME_00009102 [Camellia sinensis var. sinensis]
MLQQVRSTTRSNVIERVYLYRGLVPFFANSDKLTFEFYVILHICTPCPKLDFNSSANNTENI